AAPGKVVEPPPRAPEAAKKRDAEAVRQRKVDVKALPKAAPPAPADALQQAEQQIAPWLQRLYKAELSWMRRVCQPSREQYDQIAAATAPAVKTTTRRFAQLMRGGMIRIGPGS